MYPYHWTWLYTLIAVGVLLSLFALCGVVLLVRLGRKGTTHQQHPRPESIATPSYGALGYRQVNTEANPNEGYRRAAHTQYYPRIER